MTRSPHHEVRIGETLQLVLLALLVIGLGVVLGVLFPEFGDLLRSLYQ